MKIMIVEDEKNIREGLADMFDWEGEGFARPVLFSSAVDALQYLETEAIEVVITDLYMPVLNGIEFIRMLREQNQSCEVIILTGHERFELAQEAISLGVRGYLLKPVKEEEFVQVLREVKADLQEKIKLRDWMAIARQKLSEYLPIIQNQFWNDLISGNIGDLREAEVRAKDAEIHVPDTELSCLAIRGRWKEAVYNQVEELALRQLIQEILKDKCLYVLKRGSMELVICRGRVFRADIEILEESIRKNLGLCAGIGISSAKRGMLSCQELSAEAFDAVQSIHEEHAFSYIYYKDIENKRQSRIEYPYGDERKILNIIRLQRKPEKEMLTVFLRKIFPPVYSAEESRMLQLQFLIALARVANETGIDIVEEFRDAETAIYKLRKVEEKLLRIIDKLVSEREQFSRRYTEVIVESAKAHMAWEYSDTELSIGKIAKEIGVTPNYLSRIFKDVTKESCIEFLTRLRLEEAKRLLAQSSMKSYEIAERTGYNNPNYFSALFKKYEGCTPKDFRERMRNEKETDVH